MRGRIALDQFLDHAVRNPLGIRVQISLAGRCHRSMDGIGDAALIERHDAAVPFPDVGKRNFYCGGHLGVSILQKSTAASCG